MRLNRVTGNMSTLLNRTGNCIIGCLFNCVFCWAKAMARRYNRPFIPHFRAKQLIKPILKTGLQIGLNWNGDGFGPWVRKTWIDRTLAYAAEHPDITWYTLTKNPSRYLEFTEQIPENMILGATLESTYPYPGITKAPAPSIRYDALKELREMDFDLFIIIEPILQFDLQTMVRWIRTLDPIAVEIGAVTGGYKLPEPQAFEIHALVKQLCMITNIIHKPNLKRLYDPHTVEHPLEAYL